MTNEQKPWAWLEMWEAEARGGPWRMPDMQLQIITLTKALRLAKETLEAMESNSSPTTHWGEVIRQALSKLAKGEFE